MPSRRIWRRFEVNYPALWVLLGSSVLVAGVSGCSDSSHSTQRVSTPSGEPVHPRDTANRAPVDGAILDLRGKDITDLPGDISAMKGVRVLRLACNERMVTLPAAASSLAELEELDIDNGNGCEMKLRLSESALLPASLKLLNLSGALAKESPLPVSHLQALEALDLSKLHIGRIPAEVFGLQQLKSLRVDYMDLRELPDELIRLTSLEALHACCNFIRSEGWPDLRKMGNLQLVELGNNSLTMADQELIRSKLPDATTVDFTNVWDDGRANEE